MIKIKLFNQCLILFTDIDECLSVPCMNGGTCADLIDGYDCSCGNGYFGSNCQQGSLLSYKLLQSNPIDAVT